MNANRAAFLVVRFLGAVLIGILLMPACRSGGETDPDREAIATSFEVALANRQLAKADSLLGANRSPFDANGVQMTVASMRDQRIGRATSPPTPGAGGWYVFHLAPASSGWLLHVEVGERSDGMLAVVAFGLSGSSS